MESFEKIYSDIENEFKEKYKPAVEKKVGITGIKCFIAFAMLTCVQSLVRTLGLADTIIYQLISLIETVLIFVMIFIGYKMLSKSFEYWKTSIDFKKEVGTKFWKAVNENCQYNYVRVEMDREFIKSEIDNMLDDNVSIIDVEESLEFQNKKMYTVKYNDKNKKRFNGSFVVIENSRVQDNIEEYIKNTKENLSKCLYRVEKKKDKIYMLLDAVEVFGFSEKYFLEKKDFEEDYLRYKEINEF